MSWTVCQVKKVRLHCIFPQHFPFPPPPKKQNYIWAASVTSAPLSAPSHVAPPHWSVHRGRHRCSINITQDSSVQTTARGRKRERESDLPDTNCRVARRAESPDCGAAERIPSLTWGSSESLLEGAEGGLEQTLVMLGWNYWSYLTLFKVELAVSFHSIWPLDADGGSWNHNSVIASLCPRFNFL